MSKLWVRENELVQCNFCLFISVSHYDLQTVQIRHDDSSSSITFVEQTCVFNSKDMKEYYSDSAARNSSINEKREKYHIFEVKIEISIIFDNLTKQTQMHDK